MPPFGHGRGFNVAEHGNDRSTPKAVNDFVGLFIHGLILGAPSAMSQEENSGTPSELENTIPEMNWNQRLTLARNTLGITKSAFSRLVGVSTATTADWESETIKSIDGRNLVKVAEVLKITPEWLMTGKGGQDARAVELEFSWVYRHATDKGREFLQVAIAGAKAAYMEDLPVVADLKSVKKNGKKA